MGIHLGNIGLYGSTDSSFMNALDYIWEITAEERAMTSNNELHIIFGTGPLGLAVMRELVSKGKQLRMVNRSGSARVPEDIEVVKGDASNPDSTTEVCKGASVVYNCTNPPYNKWPELFPPLQVGIIEGAASAEAKLVSAENVYMYGKVDQSMTEDLPYAATTRKGGTRARMAQDLMKAHKEGKVRATIGRASNFFGPHVFLSTAGERVFYPALDGKAAQVLGNIDAPHTYTFIDDFGKGLVTLGEQDEALGKAWHIPNADTLTTREFVNLVFEEAGHSPNIEAVPGGVIRELAKTDPMMYELEEMLYEFEEPFIIDHSKYEKAFGANPTPHKEAINKTLEWYRQNPKS